MCPGLQLTKLQEENDSLVGKHSKHAQQLQEENIDLPNDVEELQLLVLRLREDVIQAKVAREHTEDTLRSELLFLKDQVLGEQQEKATLEEALSQEISQLQEDLGEAIAHSPHISPGSHLFVCLQPPCRAFGPRQSVSRRFGARRRVN